MGEPAQVPDRDQRPAENDDHQPQERRAKAGWWGTNDDNWWHSDPADAVGWGLAFIWGSLVLLASNTGFGERYPWWDGWRVFFVGAGVITIAIAAARVLMTDQREKPIGSLIFGLILLGIGLGDFVVWFWPVVLLAFGLYILRGVFRPNGRQR